MSRKLLTLFAAAAILLAPALPSPAAETNAASADLNELVGRVRTKLKEDKKTEEALSAELKDFDALVAKYKTSDPEGAASVLFMKAMLYEQVFQDSTKGDALVAELKKDFPNSKPVQQLIRQEEAKKLQAQLKTGAAFPDFDVKDLNGKPLSIANYKGKVVLLDFWATWCGPCVAELPNVKEAYDKHHAGGFEIIGISLDSDKEKLASFLEKKEMTWQQYFDGKGWENELAQKYGIQSIPATFLLDGEGKIIGKDLRGDALEEAVAKALKK